jgi:hypothetical protein
MKKLTLLFAVLFAASVAIAAENTTTEKAAPAAPKADAAKPAHDTKAAAAKTTTHDVTAEVVSTDVTKKEITLKDEKGESHTAPVTGKAIASLKTVKAGDKVTVTCLDDEKGAHKAVTAIKPAAATDMKAPAVAPEKPADKPAEIK